jgi:hypothetical protein
MESMILKTADDSKTKLPPAKRDLSVTTAAVHSSWQVSATQRFA